MRVAMPTVIKRVCNSSEEEIELRRGPWTLEEDTLLIHYIAFHGEGRWNMLAKSSGLKRTGKSCRLRWLNYLRPDVKRGNLTPQEQLLILELHSKWGNRWSRIAQHLPGRTDNEIKNYWRTKVQKQARHLKIDSNSTRFRDTIRCFWMPRLLQKMEQSSAYSSMEQNSSTHPLLNQVPQDPPTHEQGSLTISDPINSFNYPEKNSNSENCTIPISTYSPDSINISQLPQISEYQSTPLHLLGDIVDNPFLKDCYPMNSSTYDMESFNLASISAPGSFENLVTDSHVAERNWVGDDVAGSLWNMDELWQFRTLQERGI